jgi:hypothetical protein
MATLLFSQKKDQTDQARQVQNQSKQTKQTNPDSSVCSLDLPQNDMDMDAITKFTMAYKTSYV